MVGVLCAAMVIAACGDESPDAVGTASNAGASPPASAVPPDPSGNGAPLISGRPAGEVTAGSAYSFSPEAHDPEGSSLAFFIENRPPWAAFDASTGRLLGTPGVADVGTYRDITISVWDGTSRVPLAPFSIRVVGTATASFIVSWLPPTERSDGSVLTGLAGYKVYWGTAPGDYPNALTIRNPGVASYVIDHLPPGTYYVVMTAFDVDGAESDFSNVVAKSAS